MGGHIVNTFSNPPYVNAEDRVAKKFNSAVQQSNDAYAIAKENIAELTSFLGGLTPMEILPLFNTPEFARYSLTTSERPTAPSAEFPVFALPDLTVPVPGFNYADSPYSSELLEALRVRLLDGVENGGTGLGPEVEEAIFARERLRREQALRDSKDRIASDWADGEAGDLGLPDGGLAAQYIAAETEFQLKDGEVSYDTAVKMAELARQQQEVHLKAGTDLENVTNSKHTADMTRLLEAAKAEPEIILRVFEATVAKVKVMGEYYNALAAKVNAQAQIFDSEMKGWLGEADVGAKEMDASVKKYESDTKNAQAESESAYRTDANRVEQMKNYLMLRIEAIKGLATLGANMAAAFATSVSATASINESASSQWSESKSDSSTTTFNNNDDRDYM